MFITTDRRGVPVSSPLGTLVATVLLVLVVLMVFTGNILAGFGITMFMLAMSIRLHWRRIRYYSEKWRRM